MNGLLEVITNNYSNGSTSCLPLEQIAIFNWIIFGVLLIFALVILVVLSFTQRREKLCHGCLWGFPGLPVPVNFLVTPRYRTIYTIIFGVMATALTEVFQSVNTPANTSFYFKIFYRTLLQPLLLVLLLFLTYFPLFACVRAPRPWLGRVLGLLYSIVWFISLWLKIVIKFVPNLCDPEKHPVQPFTIIVEVASNAPIIIGAFIVVVWYFYKVVLGALKLCGLMKRNSNDSMEEMSKSAERLDDLHVGQYRQLQPPKTTHGVKHYHLLHVRSLLRRPQLTFSTGGWFKKILNKIWEYFFPYSKGFRFPLPFLGAVVAMSMLLYQLTITIVITGITLSATFPALFDRSIAPVLSNLSVITNQSVYISELTDVLRIGFIGFPVLLCISPVLSFLICLFLLIHMVGSVSKELKQIAKEGFTVKLPSPGSRVPSSWKYVGYQIGFFFLAYGIYTGLVFVGGVVCSVVYLGFRFLPELTIQAILYILVPVLWSQLFFFAQNLICKFIFFEDQKGKFIALTNKRLFNWFSFVLFFYNGFAGFIGAILRTLMASLFTLLLLFRLDRVVLMKGFERFDYGHKAYLGFMYLDYTYNNAVVHVFLNILKKSIRSRTTESSRSLLSEEEEESGQNQRSYLCRDVQARNRWLVAYTLLRNPSLQKLTASKLKAAADMKETELQTVPVACNPTIQRTDTDNVDTELEPAVA